MKIKKKSIFIILIFIATLFANEDNLIFKFVQMGDTHIGSGESKQNSQLLLSAIDHINKSESKFTVICGDLINKMEYKKYKTLFKHLDNLDSAYYLVPGNHDVGMIPSKQSLRLYRQLVGDDYYSFSVDSTLCIVINSMLWIKDIEDESEKMDQWLKKLLADERDKHANAFVFGHVPFFIDSLNEPTITNSNIPISKRIEILELFAEHNVNAVFTAHLHKHIERTYKGILFSSVEPVARKVNKPDSKSGMRIWNVHIDTLSGKFIDLR